MAKIICKPFPKPIGECIHNPHVDVIKTRKDGKDTYIYEISAKGAKPFVLDPNYTRPAGVYPDLEDTWCEGQWQGKKHNGCEYDLNLFDRHIYGDDDNAMGVGACIYSCYQYDDDYVTTDTEDYVKATVKCCFQDEKGKRTEFKYNIPDNYIEQFGEWDGTPIHIVKHPTKEVFKGAKEIAGRLKKFLKKNKLEINYEMASDTVYLLPKHGWGNALNPDILKAMKLSGKILNPRTIGTKWTWLRGSEVDENWFCKKVKEAENG